MTQASLLRHHIINSPQLPNLNTAEAATSGEIALLVTLQFISIAV